MNLLSNLPHKVVAVLEVNNYPTRYAILNANQEETKIRAKYYTDKDKIPLKYNTDYFGFYPFKVTRSGKRVEVLFLIDVKTGERVVKNEKIAGTTRTFPINGSDLHTCMLEGYQRSNIIHTIKDSAVEAVRNLKLSPNASYPLKAHFLFHTQTNQDLGNHMTFYEKALIDLMIEEGIMPNDNRDFINGLYFDFTEEKPEVKEEEKLTITLLNLI